MVYDFEPQIEGKPRGFEDMNIYTIPQEMFNIHSTLRDERVQQSGYEVRVFFFGTVMVVLVGVSENGIYTPQKWQFQLGTINIVII